MLTPLVKICGLTQPEDVMLCSSLGVDFTGFIFVPASPRCVSPDTVATFPRSRSCRVGVFAGAEPGEMAACAKKAKLVYLQLHGGESPEICRKVGPERVIKVLWPENCSLEDLQADMERFAPVCAYFLLDAGQTGGGGGKSQAFERLAGISCPRPWFLAGGIGPGNIAQALTVCRPDGIDLNSALEDAPGRKNHTLVRQATTLITHL